MPFRTLLLMLLVSALLHASAVIFIGAPVGLSAQGRTIPQIIEVRLPPRNSNMGSRQPVLALVETFSSSQTTTVSELGEESALSDLQQTIEPPSPMQPTSSGSVETSISALLHPDMTLPATYHDESELDFPPKALTSLMPEFPANASMDHVQGKVTLRVFINPRGEVDDIQVSAAAPPGYFEASAITAVKGMRFSPGQKAGIAVSSKIEMSINYGIAATEKAET